MLRTSLSLTAPRLITTLSYLTTQSRRQNTPRLFKNPKLTPQGLVQKQPRQRDYIVPSGLPNANLFWNRTQQNKMAHQRLRIARLNKLGVLPIHENGVRTYDRIGAQILKELADKDLIKQSIGRTLENLKEYIERFPEEAKGQQAAIVNYAFSELHQRHLITMNPFHFSTYCHIRHKYGLPPTETLFINFYRLVEQAYHQKDNRFKFQSFIHCAYYVAVDSKLYSEETYELMFRKPVEFKLFQDMPAVVKPLEEYVPELYTDSMLQDVRNHDKGRLESYCRMLDRIPGGSKLKERLIGGAKQVSSSKN